MSDDKKEAKPRCESCGAHTEDATSYSGLAFCRGCTGEALRRDAESCERRSAKAAGGAKGARKLFTCHNCERPLDILWYRTGTVKGRPWQGCVDCLNIELSANAPPIVATSEALRTLRTARERLTLAKASAKTARDVSSFPVTRDIDRAINDLNGGLALLDEVIHFLAGDGK